jgi:hypothetical protein
MFVFKPLEHISPMQCHGEERLQALDKPWMLCLLNADGNPVWQTFHPTAYDLAQRVGCFAWSIDTTQYEKAKSAYNLWVFRDYSDHPDDFLFEATYGWAYKWKAYACHWTALSQAPPENPTSDAKLFDLLAEYVKSDPVMGTFNGIPIEINDANKAWMANEAAAAGHEIAVGGVHGCDYVTYASPFPDTKTVMIAGPPPKTPAETLSEMSAEKVSSGGKDEAGIDEPYDAFKAFKPPMSGSILDKDCGLATDSQDSHPEWLCTVANIAMYNCMVPSGGLPRSLQRIASAVRRERLLLLGEPLTDRDQLMHKLSQQLMANGLTRPDWLDRFGMSPPGAIAAPASISLLTQPAGVVKAQKVSRPFRCAFCRSTFTKRETCANHMRSKHANQSTQSLTNSDQVNIQTASSSSQAPVQADSSSHPAGAESSTSNHADSDDKAYNSM